jgi:alpha/beta superfamily hydrolase
MALGLPPAAPASSRSAIPWEAKEYDEKELSTNGRDLGVATRLKAVSFQGPAGKLEGLWKEASGRPVGSAVFAHPHPLHGGTLHNKVVYRASQAMSSAGYGTLRFNFRGVGLSQGRYDGGPGETDDFRAALDEAQRRGGLPIVAGGFSFGSAAALRAIAGDRRVRALIAAGLPLAVEGTAGLPRPVVPALFVAGERDTLGPPALLKEFVADAGEIVVIPGADHFFEGKLRQFEDAIVRFLATLPPLAVS